MSRRRAFDRWFRYPAGFSEQTLDAALSAVRAEGKLLVDCFAGSASAGTAIVDRDIRFVGIEAHPMIAELAALKFERPGEPDHLYDLVDEVLDASEGRDASFEGEPELVTRSFDASTLSKLVLLRGELKSRQDDPWALHAKWALLATLRDVAGVSVGWPYQRPSRSRKAPHADVMKRFRARAGMMIKDLQERPAIPVARVIAGDSSNPAVWRRALEGRKAGACVTSPPYLNNFDYADATRLEAYFWGEASSWAELCRDIRADMLVATTQQTRLEVSARAREALKLCPQTSETLEQLIAKLERERVRRMRGKEYSRVIAPYFLGLVRVLAAMHEALEPGSRAAWVIGDSAPYGIYINTPELVLCLAEEVGFHSISDEVVRPRGQKWRTNGTRHQVTLAERMIVFAKPNGKNAASVGRD